MWIDFSNVATGNINSHSSRGLGYNRCMKKKLPSANANLETFLPRIAALSLLVVLLLLALTGCKNQTPVTASLNPGGDYTLVSIDGRNVPCNLTHEGAAMIVKSGSFTINADGTVIPSNTNIAGKWKEEAGGIRLIWPGGTAYNKFLFPLSETKTICDDSDTGPRSATATKIK